jgi:hypothetical protein
VTVDPLIVFLLLLPLLLLLQDTAAQATDTAAQATDPTHTCSDWRNGQPFDCAAALGPGWVAAPGKDNVTLSGDATADGLSCCVSASAAAA